MASLATVPMTGYQLVCVADLLAVPVSVCTLHAGSLAATHAHVWLDLYQLFLGSSAAVTQLVKLAGSISEPSQLVQQVIAI